MILSKKGLIIFFKMKNGMSGKTSGYKKSEVHKKPLGNGYILIEEVNL